MPFGSPVGGVTGILVLFVVRNVVGASRLSELSGLVPDLVEDSIILFVVARCHIPGSPEGCIEKTPPVAIDRVFEPRRRGDVLFAKRPKALGIKYAVTWRAGLAVLPTWIFFCPTCPASARSRGVCSAMRHKVLLEPRIEIEDVGIDNAGLDLRTERLDRPAAHLAPRFFLEPPKRCYGKRRALVASRKVDHGCDCVLRLVNSFQPDSVAVVLGMRGTERGAVRSQQFDETFARIRKGRWRPPEASSVEIDSAAIQQARSSLGSGGRVVPPKAKIAGCEHGG